ncbi:MAG: heliorhodopsin HeR [Candidatus Thermoplasmatota archaeon]|nr:heliorhodopsin HeR [Candidatus Thermoplasmatota archaeon]
MNRGEIKLYSLYQSSVGGNLEESVKEPRFIGLRKFNIAMGFLHLIQGALMLWLSKSSSLPINLTLLHYDPVTETINSQTDTLINLQLGPMIASFLFISAIAHFAVSSPRGYPWYVKNLKEGINYARWYEYAASSSVMVIVIAMLCGIFELSSLILIFSLNATMNLFGLMMELHNQTTKRTNWTSYLFGCFAGLLVWIVLGIYFFGALLGSGDSVPTFVYFIFISLAIFFNVFAVNMVLQYRAKGKWKDYLHGERVYIILSLVAKSALAWQVFAGTLR